MKEPKPVHLKTEVKVGDPLELAIWFDAEETKDPITKVRDSIEEVFSAFSETKKVKCGEITFRILKPGDDRVPDVPMWLETKKGAKPSLLVATAPTSTFESKKPQGILGDLDKKDIERLRVITRNAHIKHYPYQQPLTNEECDQIIDVMGMEVVQEQLSRSTIN